MPGSLTDVNVIEIGSYVSAPFAGKLLGDAGAEVVKIEHSNRPSPLRVNDQPYDRHGEPEFTWRFLNYNTSKRSLTLELKSEDGREVLVDLIGEADVVLENMRPGSMERLDLGWDRLQSLNPELVYCSLKGYGEEGPYTDKPALDTLVQGVSGFSTQIGDLARPEGTNVLLVDMLTGLYAAWAITAALFERTESGRGQRVDVSMLDAAISTLGHQLAEYTASQHHEATTTGYGPAFAPNGYFATADGHLAIFVPDDSYWEALCRILDCPEWLSDDSGFITNDERLHNAGELREKLEGILKRRPTAEWLSVFEDHEETVFVAPVNDVEGMIDDAQVRAQEAVVERNHPDMGRYYLPNVVPKFSRTPATIDDAPGLGADSVAILATLGYSSSEIEALRQAGVVE